MCAMRRGFDDTTQTRGKDPRTEFIHRLAVVPEATGDRVAPQAAWHYRAYRSKSSQNAEATTWVQIDLGSRKLIDAVKLYPSHRLFFPGDGFPLRFHIECSDESDFREKRLIADRTTSDFPDPKDQVVQFAATQVKGRWVRLTVTKLRARKPPALPPGIPQAFQECCIQSIRGPYLFSLSKIDVLSGGEDIAVHRPVDVDPAYGNSVDAQQLTRPPRPQGEGIITDHPQNVTSPDHWHPVKGVAQAPLAGVRLQGGIFATSVNNNIAYLLDSFSVDDLLGQFRRRAGKPLPSSSRTPDPFWEENLAGSNAGRFLMGAGNTLRWTEHSDLRSRMKAVVEGIAACSQPDGDIMAYPEDTFFVSERGSEARSWVTHGLIAAGYAGSEQALKLLRGYYDWFNQRPYLPQMLRGCIEGGESGIGMVANTQMYLTPVGKPLDIQVIQRYFQENYWLEDLAARKVDAVWQYPYDRPHCYLLANLEAYVDLYRATGDQRYLRAVLGGWELYRENWQNIGGSFSILEYKKNVPQSNPLYDRLGETCGSALWTLLNHRLHLLDPEDERYMAEIEKSIYNVLLANQGGSEGIRYHTMLLGRKGAPTRMNTCCEGMGTRLIGSLPEYIYSVGDDGMYVNLYEPSALTWQSRGETIRVEMRTLFPKDPTVQLSVRPSSPMHMKIRIRVPSWAARSIPIEVNGNSVAAGAPGTYVTLDRSWVEGDTISFVLPVALRLERYTGVDQIGERERFALEYGPILMAALGAADTELALFGAASPMELLANLHPVKDRPLHFSLSDPFGLWPATEFIPYFEVGTESFSCFPIVEAKASLFEP